MHIIAQSSTLRPRWSQTQHELEVNDPPLPRLDVLRYKKSNKICVSEDLN